MSAFTYRVRYHPLIISFTLLLLTSSFSPRVNATCVTVRETENSTKGGLLKELRRSIKKTKDLFNFITPDRKEKLKALSVLINDKLKNSKSANVIFLSTDNAARSQLAMSLFQLALSYYNISNVNIYSAGKTTDLIPQTTIQSLSIFGFQCTERRDDKRQYVDLKYSEDAAPITLFSKNIKDPSLPKTDIIYVTTCSSFDARCPSVTNVNFPNIEVEFKPIKSINGSGQDPRYQNDNYIIASEMFYVVKLLKKEVK